MAHVTPRQIVFVGFMGAGKSTAAQSAADAFGIEAVDADRVIEARLGKPIERIFAEDGEPAFRAAEERITLELLSRPASVVLALGGGAVSSESVRTALAERLVVWLDAPVEDAWARVEGSGRPLARDRAGFEKLYAAREPVYGALADVIMPAARSRQLAAVLAAAEGMPPEATLLWAASDSGD